MSIENPTSCRLCSASTGQILRAAHVFGGVGTHQFWECEKCSAVYLYPIPSEEEEMLFYRDEFEKFMSTRSGSERDWSNAEGHIKTNQDQVLRRWRYLEPHMKEGNSLLELGCSTGFMMDAFRSAGLDCVGVEPSGEFLEFLNSRGHRVFSSLQSLRSQIPDTKFDLIVHFFVFEHMRDPFSVLKEQFDLLKGGGKIIAEIPCVSDPLTSVFSIPAFERFYWSIAHHYYYSKQSLEFILNQLGYTYKLLPEQRYDLSNHITWMMDGRPGGQGRFRDLISEKTVQSYKDDLMKHFQCDTIILTIYK
jgi:SAM-dependent methyltransferase